MSRSQVHSAALAALLLSSQCLLADDDCEPQCCCNWSVSASALLWQPHEEGLDFVIKNEAGTAFANGDARVKRINPKWEWGFRVDLGYQIPCTKMQLDALWTRLHARKSNSATASEFGSLLQVWTIPGSGLSAAETAKAKWRSNLDMIDLKMSALFAPCCFLDLSPSLSFSTVWIDQKFNITTSGGSSSQNANATVTSDAIRMKNDFWGIGPKLGLDTSWWLFCGISIYGNIESGIYYGRFKIKQSEEVELAGLNIPIVYLDIDHNNYHLSRVELDINIGLKWDFNLFSDCCQASLQAGWENLYFFGQNQLMRFQTVSFPGINISNQGDLTYQGLTVKASVSF